MSFQDRELDPRAPDRDETTLVERFPSTGAGEREKLRELSAWLEVIDPEPIPPGAEAGQRRQLPRIADLAPPPYGLMFLIAGTAVIVGLLLQAGRWPG